MKLECVLEVTKRLNGYLQPYREIMEKFLKAQSLSPRGVLPKTIEDS